SPAVAWANSLVVRPESRLLDAAATGVLVTVRAAYDVPGPPPAGAFARLRLTNGAGRSDTETVPLPQLPVTVAVLSPSRGEGDGELTTEVVLPGRTVAGGTVTVSRVTRLRERLAKLGERIAALPAGPPTVERLTARSLHHVLTALANRQVMET